MRAIRPCEYPVIRFRESQPGIFSLPAEPPHLFRNTPDWDHNKPSPRYSGRSLPFGDREVSREEDQVDMKAFAFW